VGRLAIEERAHGQVRIISIRGQLGAATVDDAGAGALLDIFGSPGPAVVSLVECAEIDGAGIAMLLTALGRRQDADAGPVALASVGGSEVRGALSRTTLADLVPIFDSVDEAVAELSDA
jgi:hypothetical protein